MQKTWKNYLEDATVTDLKPLLRECLLHLERMPSPSTHDKKLMIKIRDTLNMKNRKYDFEE